MASPRHKWPQFTPADTKIPLGLWNDLLRTVEGLDGQPPPEGYSSREVKAGQASQLTKIRLVQLLASTDSARASGYQDFPVEVQSLAGTDSEWSTASAADERVLLADENQKIALLTGQRVPAWYNAQVQRFLPIVEMRVRFELTENLTFGSNATANRLDWSGSDYAANTAVSFEVYDPFSRFNQNHAPSGQTGARGYACYFSDSDRWEIIQMEHQARWIEFQVNDAAGFDSSDASFTVNSVVYHDGYEPADAVTTVYNLQANSGYVFQGSDDWRGVALYAPADDEYTVIQIECP